MSHPQLIRSQASDYSQVQVKKEFTNQFALSTYNDPTVTDEQAPENFGGPLPSFKWLCERLLDKLEQLSINRISFKGGNLTEAKIVVIDSFFNEWRTVVGPNIYPALILILPHKDRSRIYNAKDYTVGRILLEILKIPKQSKDAEHIMKWKQHRGYKSQKMSTICVETIKKRRADIKGGTLSITDVNDMLDKLALYESKREDLVAVVKRVVEEMSFVELQYFFDILLKKNVVRNMENRILYEWHPDAVSYLSVVTSLKTVAYKLYDPTIRLNNNELTINLCKPFAPQLAKKPTKTYPTIVESLGNDFFIEEKMDGERIQLHYENRGESIHYWSRKATDYTYLYGKNKYVGCISPHLLFDDKVVSCVLDGEMVTYDPVRNTILPFGILKGSAIQELERLQGTGEDEESPRPLLMVFDLLYLNGSPLTGQKLSTRKEWLGKLLTPDVGFVEILRSRRVGDVDSIKEALNLAIERGSEGIILKKADSKYFIDKRNDFWVKIKPEYLEEFGENVDLLVIGREKSKKDMYYCGLRITDDDTENYKEPHFLSFCRISNGFDSNDYRKVDDLTRGKWRDSTIEKPPASLVEFGNRLPPEWIDPRDSFVIEVRARSVVKSESGHYRTGTTLYNAFSRKIRDDKNWETAMTMSEYGGIRESRKHTDSKDHKLLSKKKRLETKRKREEKDEEVWNDGSFASLSSVFDGLTFKVLTDCYFEKERISISALSAIINQNGAHVTRNQLNVGNLQDLRIISDKVTIEATELRNVGYDILKSSWVFDCLEAGRLVNVEPRHILLVSQFMEVAAATRVDDFGVSYTNPLTVDALTKIIEKADINDSFEIDERLSSEIQLFGGLKVYLVHVDDGSLNVVYRLTKVKLEGFGAKVVDDLNDCNYIVVINPNNDVVYMRLKEIRKRLASRATHYDSGVSTIRVVNQDWVDSSIQSNERLDPQDFQAPMKREVD